MMFNPIKALAAASGTRVGRCAATVGYAVPVAVLLGFHMINSSSDGDAAPAPLAPIITQTRVNAAAASSDHWTVESAPTDRAAVVAAADGEAETNGTPSPDAQRSPDDQRGDGLRFGPGQRGGHRGYGLGMMPQWDAMVNFLTEQAPHLLDYFNTLPPGTRKALWRAQIYTHYVMYQDSLTHNESALAQVELEQFQLQDQVIVAAQQLKDADAAQTEQVKKTLNALAAKLVDNRLKERELRIAHVQELLKSAQERLTKDRAKRDEMVQRRADLMLQAAQEYFGNEGATQPSSNPGADNPGAAPPANSATLADPPATEPSAPSNASTAGDPSTANADSMALDPLLADVTIDLPTDSSAAAAPANR